jgi:alpha-L-fucosidase
MIPCVLLAGCQTDQPQANPRPIQTDNRPERVEWFRDMALGMFIHWSFDSQLGTVISHSMVGASDDYLDRFLALAKTFDPDEFRPDRWAELARLAGMKYVVFTAKHHSGFCMFETQTTDFGIMHTPFGRDVLREVLTAFRQAGIATGIYFSPDDFFFIHQQGLPISRLRPEALRQNNPQLMAHNQTQLRELLTRYGPIDILFLDGVDDEPPDLKELAWRLQPDIVITRGQMQTPEERLPGELLTEPWEACYPIGTQWQFKPTNETYKSGREIIRMLIETRAKGGNLLLNVGPTAYGQIPFEQERRLRELGTWNLINAEALFGTRPWKVTNERGVWYTQSKDGNVVYAFLTGPPWLWGERREITLRSLRGSEQTTIRILGETGRILEYRPEVDPRPIWRQTAAGLQISAMRTKRVYDDGDWPNPIVLAISNTQPEP